MLSRLTVTQPMSQLVAFILAIFNSALSYIRAAPFTKPPLTFVPDSLTIALVRLPLTFVVLKGCHALDPSQLLGTSLVII